MGFQSRLKRTVHKILKWSFIRTELIIAAVCVAVSFMVVSLLARVSGPAVEAPQSTYSLPQTTDARKQTPELKKLKESATPAMKDYYQKLDEKEKKEIKELFK